MKGNNRMCQQKLLWEFKMFVVNREFDNNDIVEVVGYFSFWGFVGILKQ